MIWLARGRPNIREGFEYIGDGQHTGNRIFYITVHSQLASEHRLAAG